MAASIELPTRHPPAASRPVGLDVSHNPYTHYPQPDGCPEPRLVAHDISGVWKLVELHDWNPDGQDDEWLGSQAPGLFVYTPEGKLSLHIMTEHGAGTVVLA